jgi:hypothetical protein
MRFTCHRGRNILKIAFEIQFFQENLPQQNQETKKTRQQENSKNVGAMTSRKSKKRLMN